MAGLLCAGWWMFKQKPSVILISLDTVRADHLSPYGYPRLTTPFLARLAKESVVFQNAYSPISVTVPSHASLFTSHYPSETKLVNNGWRLENWKLPLLAEVLEQQGYQTGAVVASPILGKPHNLNLGFEYYQDQEFEHKAPVVRNEKDLKFPSNKRLAQEVVDFGIEWLNKLKPQQPFFLFLHFYDAHRPYVFPKEWNQPLPYDDEFQKYLTANFYLDPQDFDLVNDYDNSLYYLDQNLERFFSYLKEKSLLDNTIIVIVADHGEGLGQHKFYQHWFSIYEEEMKAPLLIRFPRAEHAGAKVAAQVSLIDVAPTVLDFLKLKDPMQSRGASLLPLIRGDKQELRSCNFLERSWLPEEKGDLERNLVSGKKAGAVCGEWKLIWSDREPMELYNLKSDPLELKNLTEAEPKKYAEMDFTLAEHLKEIHFQEVTIQSVPDKVQKALKSLGYTQ